MNSFFSKKELFLVFFLFIALFVGFFFKDFDLKDANIYYLKEINTKKAKEEMINYYLKTNNFKKALELVKDKKKRFEIIKMGYYAGYFDLDDVKKALQEIKDKEFVYKWAMNFSFLKLAYKNAKYSKERANLALYFKNYKDAYENYLYLKDYCKALDIALYRGYDFSFFKKCNNKKLLFAAYMKLKDYKNAIKYAPENMLGFLYLKTKNYEMAKKYVKDKKVLLSLALLTHDYELVKKTTSNPILLKEAYIQTFDEKGVEYFLNRYKKEGNETFLEYAFDIARIFGDVKKMQEIALKYKNITPKIAYYASKTLIPKKLELAYKVVKKTKNKDLGLLKEEYELSKLLKKPDYEVLKEIVKKEDSEYYVIELAKYYLKDSPKKAYEFIKKYDFNSSYFRQTKLQIAYKADDFEYILSHPMDSEYYYYILIEAAKKRKKDLKPFYLRAYKKGYLKNDFYWYLISKNDKDIIKFMPVIEDEKIKKIAKSIYVDMMFERFKKDKILRVKVSELKDYQKLYYYYIKKDYANMAKIAYNISPNDYFFALRKLKRCVKIKKSKDIFSIEYRDFSYSRVLSRDIFKFGDFVFSNIIST